MKIWRFHNVGCGNGSGGGGGGGGNGGNLAGGIDLLLPITNSLAQ
jgi:hypothetical protein